MSAVCTGENLSTLRTALAVCLELITPTFCNKHILNPAFINVDYSALCVLLGLGECAGEHVHVIYVGFFLKHPLSSFSEAGSLSKSEAHRFSWLATGASHFHSLVFVCALRIRTQIPGFRDKHFSGPTFFTAPSFALSVASIVGGLGS